MISYYPEIVSAQLTIYWNSGQTLEIIKTKVNYSTVVWLNNREL